jgi:hypothetical protein
MNPTTLLLYLVIALPVLAQDVPTVHNDQPLNPRQTWELEELWRIGGPDDDYIFGVMIDALGDEEGNVFLLDQQLSHATMVSSDGEILRELGKEGEGPGECRMPQTFCLMPDGTVGLGQRFPGRLIKVDKGGTPAGNVDIGGENSAQTGYTMLVSASYRGGTLAVGTLKQLPAETGQSRDSFLQILDDQGQVLSELARASTYLDFGKAHFVEREMVAPFIASSTVGPDGKVYWADDRNSYSIAVSDPAGNPLRIITRDFQNPKRDKRTLDRMNALFEEQDRQLPFKTTWEVEECDQTVGELIVTADNELVVAHSRSGLDLPDGVFTRYDVFDRQGRWSHELDIRCDGNPDHDGLIWLDDGRILLVRGLQLARLTASGNGGQVGDETDGADVMEVICCRPVHK